MRRLALLALPFVFAAGPALAQASSFDNQTGHAQNASRMSGLHNPDSHVHQMDTNAANSYSGPSSGAPNGASGDQQFPGRLTTDTAPPAPGAALPLANTTPGAGAYGGTAQGNAPDSGANSAGNPH